MTSKSEGSVWKVREIIGEKKAKEIENAVKQNSRKLPKDKK